MGSTTESLEVRVDLTNTRISELKKDLKEDIGDVKRELSDLRKDNRSMLWVVIGSWATLMAAIVLKN